MPTRPPLPALALVVLLAAACGAGATATPRPTNAPSLAPSAAAQRTAGTTPAPTAEPTPRLTPVPGGASSEPEPPVGGNPGTTLTEWGRILDEVPGDFPIHPGAEPAELPEGPNSGAWSVGADTEAVATWYRDHLEAGGFTIDNLSTPLEDGSRVLDIRTDLPECRIELTFRPADGSTMIVVMYGAGCAGGDG
jgi:hypothetical protein